MTVTVLLSLSDLLGGHPTLASLSRTVKLTDFVPGLLHFVVNVLPLPVAGSPPLALQERELIALSASVEVHVKVALQLIHT